VVLVVVVVVLVLVIVMSVFGDFIFVGSGVHIFINMRLHEFPCIREALMICKAYSFDPYDCPSYDLSSSLELRMNLNEDLHDKFQSFDLKQN
jgi:hypothetical protein